MLKIGAQVCLKSFSNLIKLPAANVCRKESPILLNAQSVRNTSFFNKLTQAELWKGVLSVSNAGKKKGRGKSAASIKRVMASGMRYKPGEGKIRISWPGLNAGVIKANEVAKIHELPKPEKQIEIKPVVLGGRRANKIHPLDRGWSGRRKKGVKMGPPLPEQDLSFDGFESIVLEIVPRQLMTSKLGRQRKFSVIVATGNKDGLIGFGKVNKPEQKGALTLARARAAKRLISIDLIEKHTVNHDFYSKYGRTKVLVFKKPEGYGLRCHRVITAICQLLGIENLHAKVEGPCHVIHMIRAFIIGLIRQKTYQQMANEKKMHLVEYKKETFDFPKLLASPPKCLTQEEADNEPDVFEEYILNGKLIYRPDRKIPFYEKLPSWERHLIRTLFHRNHEKVRIELMAKYGSCRSHLADIYPECTSLSPKKDTENSQAD